MKPTEMVRQFHETYKVPISDRVGFPSQDRRDLRRELLAEEFAEYMSAEFNHDMTGIADGLADMVYIICGTALEYGIPLDRVMAEVHRSNMSKLGSDGKPLYRHDGKVLKGPAYTPPDVASVLGI